MTGRHRLLFAALLLLAAPADAAMPPPGAAACSGCHAASSNVDSKIPRLAGRDAADVAASMQGFKSGALKGTVMDRIAKGFSDAEIKAIAEWYAAQKD